MAHTKGVVPMLLSTTDNMYNPFTDFDNWYAYDQAHNYGTCEYIDRLSSWAYMLSDEEQQIAINDAVQRAYDASPKGMYKIYYEDGRIVDPGTTIMKPTGMD